MTSDAYTKLDRKCRELSDCLQISFDEALLISQAYHWNYIVLKEMWFGNEEKIKREAGIKAKLKQEKKNSDFICDSCSKASKSALEILSCEHQICFDCLSCSLKRQVHNKILSYIYILAQQRKSCSKSCLLHTQVSRNSVSKYCVQDHSRRGGFKKISEKSFNILL